MRRTEGYYEFYDTRLPPPWLIGEIERQRKKRDQDYERPTIQPPVPETPYEQPEPENNPDEGDDDRGVWEMDLRYKQLYNNIYHQ
ncbi:hypothetical protein KY362_06095 [Candidatus Woesearchaeota archaeon]|nr:hypothetical protein [Candidatus Woesearchaeota archaeon]